VCAKQGLEEEQDAHLTRSSKLLQSQVPTRVAAMYE
jgi:hypothetical protein